jgi:hypothetical protein
MMIDDEDTEFAGGSWDWDPSHAGMIFEMSEVIFEFENLVEKKWKELHPSPCLSHVDFVGSQAQVTLEGLGVPQGSGSGSS